MVPSEPTGYENEPEEIFLSLPPDLYPAVFHLEMGSNREDCSYYQRLLSKHNCRKILELGCGTGRIQEYLHSLGYKTTGIDNSRPMLALSQETRIGPLVEMDMRQLGFKSVFDAVIIPYNTLNLLADENNIRQCLAEIKRVLTGPRLLIMQLFIPDKLLVDQPDKRHFQFSLFEPEPRKKLVKESIRIYNPAKSMLTLEERYKFRSFTNPQENKNYSQTLKLAAFSYQKWKHIFTTTGFEILEADGDFSNSSFIPGNSTTLIITAHCPQS